VLAKYWHDRREEKQALNAAYRNGTADWEFGHTEHPQASATTMDVQAALSASSAAAVTETEALLYEGSAAARAEVFEPCDLHPAAAEAVSGEAADTVVAPDSHAPVTAPVAEPHRGKTREETDDDQRVEEALASGDLSSMDTLLEAICDPVLRNRLLNRLVTSYYRLRSDSKHRADFYRAADLQIEEAPSILEGIEEIGRPRPNYIDAFKSMVIVLDEDGRQDTAIAVCELALSLGLQDGTKTGFEGRINRLKKSQVRIGTVSPEKLIH
jgi:hypothetical protein